MNGLIPLLIFLGFVVTFFEQNSIYNGVTALGALTFFMLLPQSASQSSCSERRLSVVVNVRRFCRKYLRVPSLTTKSSLCDGLLFVVCALILASSVWVLVFDSIERYIILKYSLQYEDSRVGLPVGIVFFVSLFLVVVLPKSKRLVNGWVAGVFVCLMWSHIWFEAYDIGWVAYPMTIVIALSLVVLGVRFSFLRVRNVVPFLGTYFNGFTLLSLVLSMATLVLTTNSLTVVRYQSGSWIHKHYADGEPPLPKMSHYLDLKTLSLKEYNYRTVAHRHHSEISSLISPIYLYAAHLEGSELSLGVVANLFMLDGADLNADTLHLLRDVVNALDWEYFHSEFGNGIEGDYPYAKDAVVFKGLVEALIEQDRKLLTESLRLYLVDLTNVRDNLIHEQSRLGNWFNDDMSLSATLVSISIEQEWVAEVVAGELPDFYEAYKDGQVLGLPTVPAVFEDDFSLFWEIKPQIDEDVSFNLDNSFGSEYVSGWGDLPYFLADFFMNKLR